MKKKLMIIGAGGHAKVCLELAYQMNKWIQVDLLDDKKKGSKILNSEVIGELSSIPNYLESHDFFVAIGNNKVRTEIFNRLVDFKAEIATLVAKNSVISQFSQIGIGTVVMSNSVVNADAMIGKNIIVNTGTIIEHDSIVSDHVHLSPNVKLCGAVRVGSSAWIGAGSVVIETVSITEDTIIGANSTVIVDVTSPGVYVGSPLRKLINDEF